MQLLNKRITCFLELASCLSFSTAAEHLHITQQAVTYQIAELEKELGVPLFVRTTRHVSLTRAGRIMRDEFVRISRNVDEAVSKVRDTENTNFATVTIGFLSILSRSLVTTPLLQGLQKAFPEIFFMVRLYEFVELRNRFLDGELDLCVTGCTDWRDWPGAEFELIRSDPLVLVTGADSPMAREIDSTPDGLPTQEIMSRYTMVAVPDDVHLGEGPDYSYISRKATAVVPDMETMLVHISSGFGFACLSNRFTGNQSGAFRVYPAPFEPRYIDTVVGRRANITNPLILEIEKEAARILKAAP